MAFSDWSTVAANNNTTLGVNIAEGCPAANINNAIRETLAQARSAIHPTLDAFLASTSLSSARSALGVSGGSTSANNFSALTNTANKFPYMTGSDGWATSTVSAFMRTVLDDGDAATALATLGALGVSAATFGANSLSVSLNLGAFGTLLIQGGSGSIGGDSTGTITYGTAYSTAPVVIVSGGPSDTASEGSVHNYGTPGTSSASIINTSGLSNTYTWLALGKA
jgi:hypothetical protein